MSELLHDPNWAATLIQALPEGIVTLDASGLVVTFNRGAERITGWSESEAAGRSINLLLPLGTGKGAFLERLEHSGAIPPINAVDRKGNDITLAVTTTSLETPQGSPLTVLVLRDITAEDAAQRLRSYFLANISHEFRTPLSALKASVELLLEGVDGFSLSETLELVRSIHFSVTSLQTLVDNLLESVSIEAGRFRIRRRATDLPTLINEASALMKPLLERRNQALITHLPGHLPQVSVDPMRLTQVLVNLLSNASKYGPIDEPIDLTLELYKRKALKISVSDRGSGIPADDKNTIFRRFVRLDEKDKAQYGIGLGLSVVKTIVEGHGGTVGMQERVGGGSTFWFTIPLEEA